VLINAPAKVNLYLRILGKRRDGFHELETLFEKIDILDTISLKTAKTGIKLTSNDRDLPLDEANICHKAVRLIQKECMIGRGVSIHIKKSIPVAAGLGGGSSDAAATLKGLNRLWELGLSDKKLLELGGSLGSDVACFLCKGPFVIGKGRGEDVRSYPAGFKLWHLVIKPPVSLLTKAIYILYDKRHGLSLTRQGSVDRIIPPMDKLCSRGEVSAHLYNDLEDTVLVKEPLIKRIKDFLLENGAEGALLSGSGSSVFGIFGSEKEAQRAKKVSARKLPVTARWQFFVARTYG